MTSFLSLTRPTGPICVRKTRNLTTPFTRASTPASNRWSNHSFAHHALLVSAMSNDRRSALAPIPCSLMGSKLLETPHLNKGSAFTKQERQEFGLVGLLPGRINTLEEQAQRAMEQYRTHRTDIGRNIFLSSMKEQNMVLYYRLLQDHLKDMFSIIYTPTEGEAIANFSRIFRRSEGCFLDIEDTDAIESSLSHWEPDDIDIIVCSDGEQILGTQSKQEKFTPYHSLQSCTRHWRSRSRRRAY